MAAFLSPGIFIAALQIFFFIPSSRGVNFSLVPDALAGLSLQAIILPGESIQSVKRESEVYMGATASQPSPASRPSPITSAEELLNSWKEIANYLNRGVRTVQRWEAELGLPVRRVRGKSRSSVIAMRSDLNQWLRACPLTEQNILQAPTNGLSRLSEPMVGQVRASDLIVRSRRLQHDMAHAREGVREALDRLIGSLQRMAQPRVPGDDSSRVA